MRRFLLTLLLLGAPTARGAPVPPPPKLSEELLAGATWRQQWGASWYGTTTFYADGTYLSFIAGCNEPRYAGTWCIEGSLLVLREWNISPGWSMPAATVYEVEVATAHWPVLEGHWNATRVVLSDPRR